MFVWSKSLVLASWPLRWKPETFFSQNSSKSFSFHEIYVVTFWRSFWNRHFSLHFKKFLLSDVYPVGPERLCCCNLTDDPHISSCFAPPTPSLVRRASHETRLPWLPPTLLTNSSHFKRSKLFYSVFRTVFYSYIVFLYMLYSYICIMKMFNKKIK